MKKKGGRMKNKALVTQDDFSQVNASGCNDDEFVVLLGPSMLEAYVVRTH